MLIGHLGDDVKMHYFDENNCVGRFPLATNETFTSKQTNERVTSTEWHNIVMRNKAAEICEKYLSKGDKIYVEGRIKSRKWTDDKGIERYSIEIVCTDFTFLSTKKESQHNQNSTTSNTSQSTTSQGSHSKDSDLPF